MRALLANVFSSSVLGVMFVVGWEIASGVHNLRRMNLGILQHDRGVPRT